MEVDGAICSKSTEKPDDAESADTKSAENGDATESEALEDIKEPTPAVPETPAEVVEVASEVEKKSPTPAIIVDENIVVPESEPAVEKEASAEIIVVPEPEITSDPVAAVDESPVENVVATAIPSEDVVTIVESSPKVDEKLSEKGKPLK